MKDWRRWSMVILFFVVVLASLAFAFNTYSWVANAEVVDGSVAEITQASSRKGGKSYSPKIVYNIDGEVREFIPRLRTKGRSEFRVGETVKLAIADDRERVSIFSLLYLYGIPLIAIIATVTISLVATLFQNGDRLLHLLHPHLI